MTRLHNKRELPLELDSHVRTLCHVVRDADKLDIIPVVLRSMQPDRPRDAVVTLGLDDSPELWSPHVLETALAGQSPAYTQLRYLNDFKILLATWGPGLILPPAESFVCAGSLWSGFRHFYLWCRRLHICVRNCLAVCLTHEVKTNTSRE